MCSTLDTKAPASNIRSTGPVKLPIGVSDFSELVKDGFTFVDKTALIDDLLQGGAKVTLICRPRRFGKTLNLSMLQHFFAAEAYGQSTRGLFDGLVIANRPAAMMHQGRYPVIFFSFKDIKAESFQAFEDALRVQISDLYHQHLELLNSQELDEARREDFRALLTRNATLAEMAGAFHLLSGLLNRHHGKKVVILLDEYDTPIHAAYAHGFYPQLIGFMRNLLGAALKDNPYLFKSLITGILRVSKESLFSDLNNIEVHTVLDKGYGQYFGFTAAEVSGLLHVTQLESEHPTLERQIKEWYDGYRFGQEVIYNPWSIVNCLKQNGDLRPYWVNTSGSGLLKKLMAQADADFKEGLERLIRGESAREIIDPNLVFEDLDGNSAALWSLLLFSGYLTALAVHPAATRVSCDLTIPNQEVRYLYEDIIRAWFIDTMNLATYRRFLASLAQGNMPEFEALLRDYLLESVSLFDVDGRHPEKFYHGLVLGLIVGLRDTHVILSNRESGRGRYDVALLPKQGTGPAILLEFKQIPDAADLKLAAKTALTQIDTRRYGAELKQHAVKEILSAGLAFAGKEMALAYKVAAP